MSRKRFYDSKEWQYLRDTYAESQDRICERCGRACYRKNDSRYKRLRQQGQDVVFGIVHHKEHLDNKLINDPEVSLGWDNLEFLCITCHNEEHQPLKQETKEVREDVVFDESGRIVYGQETIQDGR